MHASELVSNLKKLDPGLEFFGTGAARMEKAGVKLLERMDRHSIIGAWEAVVKIFHILGIYKKIMKEVDSRKPRLAILVDYPGFNLMLARGLKKKGIRVVYYITPQVWAWGKSRIRAIRRFVDKAIVIFKFEEDLLRRHGIDAAFVGHPLLDRVPAEAEKTVKPVKEAGEDPVMALLPGSRESEVEKMLPVMLETSRIIAKEKKGARFLLLESRDVDSRLYEKHLKSRDIPLKIIKDNTYACLAEADFVFTSSGTATLECAIMERPMLITYKTSFLTALLFKIVARTPFIGLVNIIAGKEVAPEILQYDAKPERLARAILEIISSKEKLNGQVESLRRVKSSLGSPGAAAGAARIISGYLATLR